SRDMINLIKQFITVVSVTPDEIEKRIRKPKTYLLKFRSRMINDIQTRRGFSENIYSGSRTKMYNRIKYQPSSNIKFGGLIEKDAGETLYWDFYSLHLQIKDLGLINNVVLGDYTIEFGQGLAMWSPYSFSKSSNAIHPIIKRDRNLSPYTSAGEYNFLRGISLSMDFGKIIFTPFYSSIRYDATFIDSTNSFSSFNISGYHRTNNEINKKNNIKETVFGGRIDYNVMNSLDLSFLYFNTSFSNSLEPKTVHDIKGNRFDYYSLSYKTSIKNLFITGEFSFNRTALASINTIQLALSKDFIFVASIRNYPENYFSFYSNGFGETSITRNEFGIYTGFKWKTSFGIFNF
ncbi:MAG: hypothetical protein KAQ90_03870, partial [Melioribacteraceae bacterium]|nr:hypothetical protein [Melioribacteraceae bacterium]